MAATEADLGKPAACQECGQPGAWVIDPYVKEIAGRRIVVALCKTHYIDRTQDI